MFENPNSIFLVENSFSMRTSDKNIYRGRIVNKQKHHDLTAHYDVFIPEWGVTLRECKNASSTVGLDGNGSYIPLEEGTPCILACPNGILEDAVIIGSYFTNGNSDKFLNKGKGEEPFSLIEGDVGPTYFNQVSIHPNRVANPEAKFEMIGSRILNRDYDAPEFRLTLQEKAKARPQTGFIRMTNGTEHVTYTYGSQIHYSDAKFIVLVSGNKDDVCRYYTKLSRMHSTIATLIKGIGSQVSSNVKQIVNTIRSSPVSDFNEALTANYRQEQNLQLAKMSLKRAKDCNAQEAAALKQVANLEKIRGSLQEPKDAGVKVDGYIPPLQTNMNVSPNNYEDRFPAISNTTSI